MVFQSYALFPHLSVAENILFGLRVRDVPRAERDARLKRAAGILGLEALLERKPSQLSGGQQQRVALGRAIVAETRVCLMDEPLSNLDAQLRVEMRREIRALQHRLGMTMLYVTHDQVEAMTMADQVVLMRNGRIEQDAAPAVLYERPATIFAARFVGTPPMNVIPGRARFRQRLARRPGRPRARYARDRHPSRGRAPRRGRHAGDGRGGRISRRRHADRHPRGATSPSSCACPAARHAAVGDNGAYRLGAGGRALVRSVVTASHRSIKQATSTGRTHHGSQTISRRHRGARRQRRSPAPRSRKAPPKSRSSIRSRSAARSPRSSTAMRPISRRPIRRSR